MNQGLLRQPFLISTRTARGSHLSYDCHSEEHSHEESALIQQKNRMLAVLGMKITANWLMLMSADV